MEFTGRTAFITGGASGMGLLSGQKLAEAGANVVLCDVNQAALEKAAEGIRAAGGKPSARWTFCSTAPAACPVAAATTTPALRNSRSR